jgi:hypothetical protein
LAEAGYLNDNGGSFAAASVRSKSMSTSSGDP